MSEDIDDLKPDELEEEEERLKAELEEHEKRFREILIEERRKRIEIQCLEYVKFRMACEEAVEDQPVFHPETDPLRN